MKSPYNRLYLAAKIYGPDSKDGGTEAAIVLWRRGNDGDIRVMEVASFGTKDLSEEHKSEFAGKANMLILVGVKSNGWSA
mgnify:CR=1 FL=1